MGVRSSRFVLFVSMLGALAAFLVALVVGSATNADTSSPAVTSAISTPAPVVSDEQPAPGTEVVDRRTEDSKTYERADGAYVTRLFPQAVNFRDGVDWRSIDNTLVEAAADGYVHRRANAGDALIPRSLDDPFKVSKDGDWVSFELQNADPGATDAALDGNTATFDGVAEATRAEYDAVNDGLKETLTLASAQAPRSFAYAVKASNGLSPQQADDGSIRFTDGQGHVRFVFSAPIAWDAAQPQTVSHAARLALTATDDGWRVTLSIDGDWLTDPSRRFPVTIDPNVQWPGGGEMRYSGAQRDCTLSSATPTTSACANTSLTVGSTSSATYKSLLYFNTRQVIPQDADVFDATLLMHVGGTGTAPASNLRVRPVTRDWTNGATWNTANGSTAWTTPGGDVSATPADASPPVSVSGLNAWYYWAVPAGVVQDWIDGSRSDFGLQVAADAGSPTQTYAFESTDGDPYKWPAVDIYWEEDQGAKSTYTLDTQRLSASSQVAVNVANGDLMYSAADAHIAGTNGLDLNSARVWDSVDNWTQSTYGLGWTDTNHLQLVHDDKDGSVYISDQTGAHYRFAPSGTGTFTTPAGINATLCTIGATTACTRDGVNAGIKYKLTDNTTGRRYYLWESSGVVGAIKDTANNTINFDWQSTYQQINGTNNTRLRFNLDTSGYATSLTDGTHTALFLRGGTPDADMLRSNTDFTGVTTTYTYNDAGYLTRISDTQGHDTRIDWQEVPDFGSWRATKITRVLDPAHLTDTTKNPTITYSYDVANHTTVVTDAAGNATATPADDGQTTYKYDKNLTVTSASPRMSALPAAPAWSPADTQGDTTRPTSTPSGDLYNDGLYVDGQGTTNITLAATDPAASSGGTISGIRRVALEEGDNANQPTASQSTCSDPTAPPRTCPASVSPTVPVDETVFLEGAHHFRQVTQDLSGNTSVSASWTVNVDRTGPPPPSNFTSSFDDESNSAEIAWNPTVDPTLPGGTPGSGFHGSRYRYQIGSGTFSSWADSGDQTAIVPSVSATTAITVQVQALDNVGNLSTAATATVTAGSTVNETAGVQMDAALSYQASYGGSLTTALAWMATEDRAVDIDPDVEDVGQHLGIQAVWADNDNRRVKLGVSNDADRPAINSMLADRGLTGDADIVSAVATPNDLDDAQHQIASSISDLIDGGLVLLAEDSSVGLTLDIASPASPSQEQRVRDAAAAVTVPTVIRRTAVTTYSAHAAACNRTYVGGVSENSNDKYDACDYPIRGGTLIASNTRTACTAGFNATDNRGHYFVITAGHCFSSDPASTWGAMHADGGSAAFLGAMPRHANGHEGDYGAIAVDDSLTPMRPWIFVPRSTTGSTTRDTRYTINRGRYVKPHWTVCVDGSRTGAHCGIVTARKADIHYDNGTTVNLLGVIHICGTNHGDSGGPVFKRHAAFGIYSGFNDQCDVYYQNINDALKPGALDLALVP